MNILARCVLAACVLLCAGLAHSSSPDPIAAIAACRAKHAEQAAAHIGCLEQALRGRSDAPLAQEAPVAQSAAQPVAQPGLGAEQVRSGRSQESADEVMVEIESATYSFDGIGLFRMTDGQVWKASESTSREQRLEPAKRYTARIERGKIGGYRMHIEGMRRMVKVRRVE